MTKTSFNALTLRRDFPILSRTMNGKPLVYLDNAATTQKPVRVIDRMSEFYRDEYATIHRGVYALSQDSTAECEETRERCRRFLNAACPEEIVFVRGATEAINLVASTFADKITRAGDEILLSEAEHHSNIVPWQELARRKGLTLGVVPVDDTGEIRMDVLENKLKTRVKMLAVTHVSNVLGTVNPVRDIVRMAHSQGARVLIDGAQAAPHLPLDVRKMDCDFYCFSSHKIYGPTGVGVLYGKSELLESMPPYQFGGDMIESVSFEKTEYAKPPAKFEAGTPAIVEIVGLGAALAYLEQIGLDKISEYEKTLSAYTLERFREIKDLRVIGNSRTRTSLVSFVIDGVHPTDIAAVLDQEGIAIRAGHLCSQPTLKRFGITATARASFAFYNTPDEIDSLVTAIHKAMKILA